MIRRTFGLFVSVGLCGLTVPTVVPGGPAPSASPPGFTGSIGCAAAACHNGGGIHGREGNEYSTWARDPHAQAFAVLQNSVSQSISRNLHRPEPAYKDALCLACHATPAPAHNPDALADGVGCESCHGPAERWRGLHIQAGWKSMSPAAKADLGFAATKDMVKRAEMCAACHVGTPDKEVNHDLIAAGHPRLAFELSGYLASYTPKHWTRDKEPYGADLEARTWAIGQLVSARAATDLLKARAEKASVWPELAEYGCFGCHHDLKGDANNWRAGKRYADLPVGSLPWGAWYFALPESAEAAPDLAGRINGLSALMAKPYPPTAQVAADASKLREALDAALKTVADPNRPAIDKSAVTARIRALIDDSQKPNVVTDWEQATQRYLAIAAFYQTLGDFDPASRTPDRRAALMALREELAFPSKPKPFESPPAFAPTKFRQLLSDLDRTFAPKG